jgi:hypothetical protein
LPKFSYIISVTALIKSSSSGIQVFSRVGLKRMGVSGAQTLFIGASRRSKASSATIAAISDDALAEDATKSFCQRVEVDIFDGHFKARMPVAAAPLGLADIYPVGCLITDALEAIPFHKGFQQIDGMAVFLHPVTIDTPGDPSQDMTG